MKLGQVRQILMNTIIGSFITFVLFLSIAKAEFCEEDEITEASGIARVGNKLLIVGDEAGGKYFEFELPPNLKVPPYPDSLQVRIERACKVLITKKNFPLDFEAIDVIEKDGDGKDKSEVVILSERLHSLLNQRGVWVEYYNQHSEFAGRGLEGLAIRSLGEGSSRIAVLWEGGYPEHKRLALQLRPYLGGIALYPTIWVHDIKKSELSDQKHTIKLGREVKEIHLNVPTPSEWGVEPYAQRFRAPDLVWHEWKIDKDSKKEWGFIVLISSESAVEEFSFTQKYQHKWLQRFTKKGLPFGKPLKLSEDFPTDLPINSKLRTENWEGLGWFKRGESLLLIHDGKEVGPTALIVSLPKDWR